MKISDIITKINQNLAEEMLPISRIKGLVDDVIDDINASLCSCYPTLTEFCDAHTTNGVLDTSADYNFFPDRYLRSVVCKGAAYLYYVQDEEGNMAAQMFSYNYNDAMFNMTRDMMDKVPDIYIDDATTGAQEMTDNTNPAVQPYPLNTWSW